MFFSESQKLRNCADTGITFFFYRLRPPNNDPIDTSHWNIYSLSDFCYASRWKTSQDSELSRDSWPPIRLGSVADSGEEIVLNIYCDVIDCVGVWLCHFYYPVHSRSYRAALIWLQFSRWTNEHWNQTSSDTIVCLLASKISRVLVQYTQYTTGHRRLVITYQRWSQFSRLNSMPNVPLTRPLMRHNDPDEVFKVPPHSRARQKPRIRCYHLKMSVIVLLSIHSPCETQCTE